MEDSNPYQAPQSSVAAPRPDARDYPERVALLNDYVFQNTDYYEKHYPALLQGEGGMGFNWAAALVTTPWLAYRKLYAWLLLYWGVTFSFGVVLFFIIARAPGTADHSLSLTLAFSLGLRYLVGRQANRVYLSRALRKVEALAGAPMDRQALASRLSDAGGTSGLACMLAVIFSILVNMLSKGL